MYNLVICEDNPLQLAALQKELTDTCNYQKENIACYSSAKELIDNLQYIPNNPHLFLLDIKIGEESGIELAKKINALPMRSAIIYVTGYIHYAPEVYDTQHTYFVLKTQLKEKLPLAIQKAEQMLLAPSGKPILIQLKGDSYLLPPEDILYLERNLRKTHVHCAQKHFDTYQSFEHFTEVLPHKVFIQCHKSFIVNLFHVKTYRRTCIVLHNDIEIPVSRRHELSTKQALLDYLVK